MEQDSTSATSSLIAPSARPHINTCRPMLAAAARRAQSRAPRIGGDSRWSERTADWAHSRRRGRSTSSWNSPFAVVSAVMIAVTLTERPNVPVRIWVVGYAVQCVVHVVLVWAEFRRRRREEDGDEGGSRLSGQSSFARRCDSLNTMASFAWWILGFYLVISGGEVLLQDAPRLYWLTVVFLAFDVFFAIFCVGLACVIGIALCCCLPCIIAILYAVAGQEGASDADISMLPRYRYIEPCEDEEKVSVEGLMIPVTSNGGSSSHEGVLLKEDAITVTIIFFTIECHHNIDLAINCETIGRGSYLTSSVRQAHFTYEQPPGFS
ncbi:uncharacterized protein A4U43_UnF11330 [Asparagus officinalis]|uniref:RING-type E3 ubiquitin transferase n=1 Tax=Asparagus officinalis TaxID=4686 RepID=A0A1R3L597_ASPOF|nr:uncharacterized protein A4U43_UnF11330 [Asparagus officinalis]